MKKKVQFLISPLDRKLIQILESVRNEISSIFQMEIVTDLSNTSQACPVLKIQNWNNIPTDNTFKLEHPTVFFTEEPLTPNQFHDIFTKGFLDGFSLRDSISGITCLFLRVLSSVSDSHSTKEISDSENSEWSHLKEATAAIAYDFNSHLTSIMGSIGIALKETQSSSTIRNLYTIENSAGKLAILANTLSLLSGEAHIKTNPVNLKLLLLEQENNPVVGPRNTNLIKYEFPKNELWIEGDASHLGLVLLILFFNARERGRAEEDQFQLSAGSMYVTKDDFLSMILVSEAIPGDYHFIQIIDRGNGILGSNIESLRIPVQNFKFQGSGVGFTSLTRILKSHKGALDIKPEEGGGARIRLYFPAREKPKEEERIESSYQLSGVGHILVVDDESMIRRVVERMLTKYGFEVSVAQDGLEAVEMFKETPQAFSAVLMDINMPRMNGIEATTRILKDYPTAKIILSSGYSDIQIPEILPNGSKAKFIAKPYRPSELVRFLKKAMHAP